MNIKEKAKEFAILAHKGQVRKSDKEKPMIIHPINVGLILEEYEFDDNVVASGYLHDVIEDTKYSEEDILKLFNEDITSLVVSASEMDKTLSWEERKQHTIDSIKNLDLRHKAIICADKISNLEDLIILKEISSHAIPLSPSSPPKTALSHPLFVGRGSVCACTASYLHYPPRFS